jgi:allantoinase
VAQYDMVLRAHRLLTSGREEPGCVGVIDGRIAAVEPLDSRLEGRRVVDLGRTSSCSPGWSTPTCT